MRSPLRRHALFSSGLVRGGRGGGSFWLLLFAFFAASLQAVPLSFTDDSGTTLIFTTPPRRIISLAPNLTELAYAAGLADKLVAVTAYSDYPPEAKKLPLMGDAFRLDWERLLALQPDLVLGWQSGLSARDRAMFSKLGLRLLVLEPRHLEDIPKALRLLGQVGGTGEVAEASAREFERQRDGLRLQYAARAPMRAYFQIADTPLLTVNGDHIISDVLRLCGAENVFTAAPLLTPTISTEALLTARPEVLLALAVSPRQMEDVLRTWRLLPLPAVKQQHYGFFEPDLMSRASPRILQGATAVCSQIDAARRTFSRQ
ncbi:cobalamin-binding protein [Ferriphaselus amnicola]|uniref:cobalamin-binding protein n=1 Tax=Ferriphaselus amnicola TaxID=1188319 RepID=UPI001559DB43|nr:cobalamin-binding protein [Ferriphaselus amnicola]